MNTTNEYQNATPSEADVRALVARARQMRAEVLGNAMRMAWARLTAKREGATVQPAITA